MAQEFAKIYKADFPSIVEKMILHVANDEDALLAFVETSGVIPADLAGSLNDVQTQYAFWDFMLSDDDRLLDFCSAHNYNPERLGQLNQFIQHIR